MSDGSGGVPTWVVGGSGLLGSHVVGSLRRRAVPVLVSRVPWQDPPAARTALKEGVRRLAEAAGGGPWQVAWCAGAGVVATGAEAMAVERAAFVHALDELAARLARTGAGALFLASSAGGVYAGSPARPPFTEHSPVGALVAYGHTKLDMERDVTEFAERTGTPVLVGRIANLYGPGQDLTKPQGLVSQLSRAHATRQPLTVYVSLDTLRDYVYAADVGDLVAAGLTSLRARTAGLTVPVVVKVVATGTSLTIGALIGESTRLHRSRARVVAKAPLPGSGQIRDLRLRSVVWPELDSHLVTPMLVGMARTSADVGRRLRAGPQRMHG
ncbi:MAG TPA: NAD-dependent epimerase/dehydratase family protein [Nocardioidaceae bacterium]|nr:NAD-dependent epimerase/dehydratase family protein [Nocardioidaceae bacterium]